MLKDKSIVDTMSLHAAYEYLGYGAAGDQASIPDPFKFDGFAWQEPLIGAEVVTLSEETTTAVAEVSPETLLDCGFGVEWTDVVEDGPHLKKPKLEGDSTLASATPGEDCSLLNSLYDEHCAKLFDDLSDNSFDLDAFFKEIGSLNENERDELAPPLRNHAEVLTDPGPNHAFDNQDLDIASFYTIDLSRFEFSEIAPLKAKKLQDDPFVVKTEAASSMPPPPSNVPTTERIDHFHPYAQKQAPRRRKASASTNAETAKSSRVEALEARRLKKKGQNKTAAQRYRLKKRQEACSIFKEEEEEERKNTELRKKVEGLEMEIGYLKNLMEEIRMKKGEERR